MPALTSTARLRLLQGNSGLQLSEQGLGSKLCQEEHEKS